MQTAIAIPEDDNGYTVYSSTQWVQQVQFAVAGVLGISNNKYKRNNLLINKSSVIIILSMF